ncbi:RCC1 domain-containing protein [Nannocystis pusilla]|uniref:RCC1 domain-containing protein n=1 Tax=Nannocystis pusilla TaxID=889268 RepID=UPI003B76D4B3
MAGDRFRCGLSRAGGVNCWGNNYSGQLGAISDLGSPVETVRGIDDAESLFAGSASACARRRDGSTWCWGDNQGGQLDDGRPVSVRLPGQAWHLPGLRALAVARDRTCAVLADGEITCWGTRAAWTRPRPANAPGPADALALGDYYDCALLRSGQVACRTLHRSRHEQIPDPSRGWWVLPDRGPIAAFLTLFNTVVSLHRDGSLKLWDPLHAPVADRPGFLGGTQLCVSIGAYFIRQDDGRVRCSGEECSEVHSLADIAAIATTWDSFCALDRDGSLRCTNDRSRKAMFAVPGRYSEISGSLANLCALAEDRRSVYCWGHSLLGRPTSPYIDTPLGPATVAPLSEPAQSIVVGETHVCATFSGERLTCWGANDRGQLGNGKSGSRALPAVYPQL